MEKVPQLRLFGSADYFKPKYYQVEKDNVQFTSTQGSNKFFQKSSTSTGWNSQFHRTQSHQKTGRFNKPTTNNYYEAALQICEANNLLDNYRYPYLVKHTCLCHNLTNKNMFSDFYQKYSIKHNRYDEVNYKVKHQTICNCNNHNNSRSSLNNHNASFNNNFYINENQKQSETQYKKNNNQFQQKVNLPKNQQKQHQLTSCQSFNNNNNSKRQSITDYITGYVEEQENNKIRASLSEKEKKNEGFQQTSQFGFQMLKPTDSVINIKISEKEISRNQVSFKQISNLPRVNVSTFRSQYQDEQKINKSQLKVQGVLSTINEKKQQTIQSKFSKKITQINSKLPNISEILIDFDSNLYESKSKAGNLIQDLVDMSKDNIELQKQYIQKLDNILKEVYQKQNDNLDYWSINQGVQARRMRQSLTFMGKKKKLSLTSQNNENLQSIIEKEQKRVFC